MQRRLLIITYFAWFSYQSRVDGAALHCGYAARVTAGVGVPALWKALGQAAKCEGETVTQVRWEMYTYMVVGCKDDFAFRSRPP